MFFKNLVNKFVNNPLKYKVNHGNLSDCVITEIIFGKITIISMDHSKDLPICLVIVIFIWKAKLNLNIFIIVIVVPVFYSWYI